MSLWDNPFSIFFGHPGGIIQRQQKSAPYMPHAAKPESGKRLARDMRRVRESRNITIDDLHDETKIPEGLIETFEDKALFDHPQFNRVYLRSFVRTYANVIGIDPEVALNALEEALSDRYTGSLAVEYLGEAPFESTTADRGGAQVPDVAPARITPPDEDDGGVDEPDTAVPTRESDFTSTEKMPGSERREETTPPPFISTPPETLSDEDLEREAAESEGAEEWTLQSPPRPKEAQAGARTSAAGSGSRTRHRKPASRFEDRHSRSGGTNGRWIVAVVALIVVAAVVWVILSTMDGRETAVEETVGVADTAAASVDTAALEQPTSASTQPMPTLGDTLRVLVFAAMDRLDPIRVTVDDDLRRPYWLEQGDSMAFAPTNRIVVEEQLDDIQLTIEGIEYPTDRRDDLGRIVITRDSVRTYFASNAGL